MTYNCVQSYSRFVVMLFTRIFLFLFVSLLDSLLTLISNRNLHTHTILFFICCGLVSFNTIFKSPCKMQLTVLISSATHCFPLNQNFVLATMKSILFTDNLILYDSSRLTAFNWTKTNFANEVRAAIFVKIKRKTKAKNFGSL